MTFKLERINCASGATWTCRVARLFRTSARSDHSRICQDRRSLSPPVGRESLCRELSPVTRRACLNSPADVVSEITFPRRDGTATIIRLLPVAWELVGRKVQLDAGVRQLGVSPRTRVHGEKCTLHSSRCRLFQIFRRVVCLSEVPLYCGFVRSVEFIHFVF